MSDEDRATLRQLEERLRRDVQDMLAVLEQDVPAFVRRTVRRAFVESPKADAMNDAALKQLKADTEKTAKRAQDELSRALGDPARWMWPGPDAPPATAEDLDAHPIVAPALGVVQEQTWQLLQRAGIEVAKEACRYRLPAYFVAGRFMKSLVEGWWRTLVLHWEVQERLRANEHSGERERRESRWDKA